MDEISRGLLKCWNKLEVLKSVQSGGGGREDLDTVLRTEAMLVVALP